MKTLLTLLAVASLSGAAWAETPANSSTSANGTGLSTKTSMDHSSGSVGMTGTADIGTHPGTAATDEFTTINDKNYNNVGFNDRDNYYSYIKQRRDDYNSRVNNLSAADRARYNDLNSRLDKDLGRQSNINESNWNSYRDDLNKNLNDMNSMFDSSK